MDEHAIEGQPLEDNPSQFAEEVDPLATPEYIDELNSGGDNDQIVTGEGITPSDFSGDFKPFDPGESVEAPDPSEEVDSSGSAEEIDSLLTGDEVGSLYTGVEVIPADTAIESIPADSGENVEPLYSAEEVAPFDNDIDVGPAENSGEVVSLDTAEEVNSTYNGEDDNSLYSVEEVPALNNDIEASSPDTGLEVESLDAIQVPDSQPNEKKIALILSGGGARGAFQVGAERYARQVRGYHWDIIAGVSVGAMNGAMLSMHRFERLLEIWENISDDQIYTGGFNLPSVIKLLFGAKSFYGNRPLQRMMEKEFEAGKIIDDLHVGAVSLITGEYVQFTKEFLELPAAILASSSIPVIWPPVDISPENLAMVDGGVRNNSPVGDVLELEPDEIVIINCSPQKPPVIPYAPENVLSIGMRALDIMQNEIFVSDIKEFLRINALVKEAQEHGIVLHHPRTGRVLKYYPCSIIEPDADLGETLDFSHLTVQASLKAGVRRAREVLGRP